MTARRGLPLLAAVLLVALAPHAARAQRAVEVQVAPPFLRLRPGTQAMVLATAYDREGMPVDARLYWSSTNINVATVDSTGAVHAIAPGIAVITAATDSGTTARRRFGRSTILVMGNDMYWAMPHEDKRLADPGDTLPPAQCNDPDVGMRNTGRLCWDYPAVHHGPAFLDAPEECTPPVTPPVFMVRVDASGHVADLRALNVSTCATYQTNAENLVRGLEYMPARRNGRTVPSWTIVAVRSARGLRVYVPPPMPPNVPQPARPNPDKVPPRP